MSTANVGQPTDHVREPEADLIDSRKSISDLENQGVAALPPLSPSLEEFYCDIPTPDGWQSKCKIVKPKSTSFSDNRESHHPLIVYFYGGGFGLGSPEQVTRPAREWAEQHNATVVCPSYRLTPENPWPQGVKDGWDVVSYLSRHAETDQRFGKVKLNQGFIVGGVSAGGGVAGVVGGISVLTESNSQYKLTPPVEKLVKPLTGLFLAVPVLAHEQMIPPAYKHLFTAWEDNRHDPTLTTASMMRTFRDLHCTDYKSPWFSPINVLELALPESLTSSTPELKINRHPLVYMQSCAKDPLRDDPLIYHKLLKDVGLETQTKMDFFPDDGHTAWTSIPFEIKSKNPTIKEAVLDGMNWLLRGK